MVSKVVGGCAGGEGGLAQGAPEPGPGIIIASSFDADRHLEASISHGFA